MHRAGALDTRVALQRKTTASSSSGDLTETWSTIGERWAEYMPFQRAQEMNVAAQWVAREQVSFTIRWDEGIKDLTPVDRIVCPAVDANPAKLQNRSIYDIIAVH